MSTTRRERWRRSAKANVEYYNKI